MIRMEQATEAALPLVEDILLDAVQWMKAKGIQNLWNESNICWEQLSYSYQIDEFFLGYQEEKAVACMALTDYDTAYWPQLAKGEALFLHKLAVKRCAAGKGWSERMITFAKEQARKRQITSVRLDCNAYQKKLRMLYEAQGFTCVKEQDYDGYRMALYVYYV